MASSNKIRVSYLVVILYVITFLLALLLVTLLPSISGVKRGNCENNSAVLKVKDPFYAYTKRQQDLIVKFKANGISAIGIGNLKEVDECPEVTSGLVFGPWFNTRLPTNVVPLRYEVEFYNPLLSYSSYNGEVTIDLEITQDLDTILLNANNLNVILPSLLNGSSDSVELKCADYYRENQYFVIRLKSKISPIQGPFKLKLYFNGFLDLVQDGLFSIKYKNEAVGFDGQLVTSHFEPLGARQAFPCFDEVC